MGCVFGFRGRVSGGVGVFLFCFVECCFDGFGDECVYVYGVVGGFGCGCGGVGVFAG